MVVMLYTPSPRTACLPPLGASAIPTIKVAGPMRHNRQQPASSQNATCGGTCTLPLLQKQHHMAPIPLSHSPQRTNLLQLHGIPHMLHHSPTAKGCRNHSRATRAAQPPMHGNRHESRVQDNTRLHPAWLCGLLCITWKNKETASARRMCAARHLARSHARLARGVCQHTPPHTRHSKPQTSAQVEKHPSCPVRFQTIVNNCTVPSRWNPCCRRIHTRQHEQQ